MMSILVFIKHFSGSSSHCNKGGKKQNQRNTFGKKMSLFMDNMIIYVGNPGVVCACSVMFNLLQTHGLVAHQAPLFMGFPRQEYWSGFPFPTSRD